MELKLREINDVRVLLTSCVSEQTTPKSFVRNAFGSQPVSCLSYACIADATYNCFGKYACFENGYR